MSRPARPSSAKAKSPDAAGESRASTAALRAEIRALRQALAAAQGERAAAQGALDACIEHSPVGVALFDRDLICRKASPRWLSNSRLTAQQALGHHHYEILPDTAKFADLHDRVLAGERFSGAKTVDLPDGGRGYGRWELVPWRDAGGEVLGMLVMTCSAGDIVEARETAAGATRAKSEFLASMSHEIRTPLNGVMGVAGALARTSLAPDQREMVKLIEGSARTLERLLTDVLDLARIESGRFELKDEPFDLGELLQSISALFEARANEKAIAFESRIDRAALGRFAGDPMRLRQILSNLLSNAVKFTKKGTVRLIVDAEPADDMGRLRLNFHVRDSGIGFDPAAKARLFERYEASEAAGGRRYGDVGLELAVSRSLAEAMGGSLVVRAQPGVGSEFIFSLQLSRTEGEAGLEPGLAGSGNGEAVSERPIKVLLAEDHPTNRKVVELILGAAGIHLVSVENGEEAIQASSIEAFDLILMDVQMPVMDGLTAIRAIRSRERVSGAIRTPIVSLTANAMPEHARASRAAGADDHVTKPVSAQTLLDVVTRAASGDYDAAARAAAAADAAAAG